MDEGTPRSRACRAIPPLAGHAIALTGHRRSDELAALVEAVGATTLVGPMLRVRPDGDHRGGLWAATAAVIACPPDYFIATTAIGVRAWLDAAATWGLRNDLVDALRRTRIVARGPKVVGALHTASLPIWRSDRTGTIADVVDALAAQRLDGARVAVQVPATEGALFVARVEQLGANVVAVDAYDLAAPDDPSAAGRLVRAVAERRVSAVTFTSRAAVRNFAAIARDDGVADGVVDALRRHVLPLCVGAVTAGAIVDLGVTPSVPAEPTLGAMVETLAADLWQRHHRHLRSGTGSEVVLQGRLVVDRRASVLLSDREAAVLRRLTDAAGRVVGGDSLLRSVWPNEDVDPAVIETTMARLRRRLRGTGVVIETVRRRGYVVRSRVEHCDPAANLSTPVPA
jgi:uroporphyrinogen-III synthase